MVARWQMAGGFERLCVIYYPSVFWEITASCLWSNFFAPRSELHAPTKSPPNRNQTIKTAKRIKESNTTSIPLIPSQSKMESKQSKSRENPGKYRTLMRYGARLLKKMRKIGWRRHQKPCYPGPMTFSYIGAGREWPRRGGIDLVDFYSSPLKG